MIEYALALAAGIATIVSPCILPVLPILLATTAGRGRSDPLWIISGFIGAFAVGGIALGSLAGMTGQLHEWVRTVSIVLLLLAGLSCLWSAPFYRMTVAISALVNRPNPNAALTARTGRAGLLVLGASLGTAWTPCAGPVLASVLALAASAQAPGKSTALLGAYATGAGLPMLAIAYGGNQLTNLLRSLTNHSDIVRKAFGGIAIAVAILQLVHYDKALIAWATQWLPTFSTGL